MRKTTLTLILAACASAFAAIGADAPATAPLVTPVSGPSNFHRIGVEFDSSDMGRTGVWGPSPDEYAGPPENFEFVRSMPRTVTLSGADIYRLSCRGCHKADAGGAPPEVPTVSGPVQATSASFMEQLMKERGRPITPAFARELSSGSMTDLLNRLKNGGQKMPSFEYLTGGEVRALISDLYKLCSVPGGGRVETVSEPAARVGELLVKGTCHTCHDATGIWPSAESLLQGTIPPISGFTTHKTLPEFIWKVRHGAPVIMGSLELSYRGRMPVFDYVTDDEAASAYMYLIEYAPQNAPAPQIAQHR